MGRRAGEHRSRPRPRASAWGSEWGSDAPIRYWGLAPRSVTLRCVDRSVGQGGFELRDHTADIALYVWGDSPASLFRAAAEGLYATIGELRGSKQTRQVTLTLAAGDAESLLHDFLAELHYRFETHGELLSDFTFETLEATRLQSLATAARVDPAASVFDREVKAVTYHDLAVVRVAERLEVTIVLDI